MAGPPERRRRLILVVISTLVGLLLAEGIARSRLPASWYDELHVASEDPLLGVDMRPGADFSFEGAWVELPPTRVTISSQGLRDDEVAPAPAEGTERLLCLGDSFTFGWGVEAEDAFCQRLEGLLEPAWETVNLGIPGQNTKQQIRRLELQGLAFAPDVVLVQFEEGDLEPPLDYSHLGTLRYLLASRSALARLVILAGQPRESQFEQEWEAGENGVVGAEGWNGRAETRAAFSRLAELGREHGFDPVVFTDAPQLNEITQHLEAEGIPWESMLPALEGPEELLFIPEDGHWTAEGHRRVAELMAYRLAQHGIGTR